LVGWFSLFVSLVRFLNGWLFGFDWLVGWLFGFDWLVGFLYLFGWLIR
jgi:hypothetical protein